MPVCVARIFGFNISSSFLVVAKKKKRERDEWKVQREKAFGVYLSAYVKLAWRTVTNRFRFNYTQRKSNAIFTNNGIGKAP